MYFTSTLQRITVCATGLDIPSKGEAQKKQENRIEHSFFEAHR